jgi:hypothetical protein
VKAEQLVVEAKRSRPELTAKKIGEELMIDIGRYSVHPDYKALFCFVYDPERRIRNPHGIEHDLSKEHDGLRVEVLIVQ